MYSSEAPFPRPVVILSKLGGEAGISIRYNGNLNFMEFNDPIDVQLAEFTNLIIGLYGYKVSRLGKPITITQMASCPS